MPPNSSAMGPPAVWVMLVTSWDEKTPPTISVATPSSAASTMSITSKAIARMTAANTANVT